MSRKVLAFLYDYIDKHGYAPSIREICAGVGLRSTSTVWFHLDTLESQGLIRRTPGLPRALVLIPSALLRSQV